MSYSRSLFYFFITLMLSLLFFVTLMPVSRADAAATGATDYPMISEKEMGQLRWALDAIDKPLDDFSAFEPSDQFGMSCYKYSLAFMAYFLAVEQYAKLPACPEIIKPRLDRIIEKMTHKKVWEYWAKVSQGVPDLEPKMDTPYPEQHDPVVSKNIMYSGHLGQMIALYETLYRDFKYSRSGAIQFKWQDDEVYEYDNHAIQKIMYAQMLNNPDHCIECEPNACFPECNQHPVLSFMLYDYLNQTDYAEAGNLFFDFFLEKNLIDLETHEVAGMYLVKQKMTLSQQNPRMGNRQTFFYVPAVYLGVVNLEMSTANGWTGVMMHAWKPDFIERHYPYQLENHLKVKDDNTAWLKKDTLMDQIATGFFAMLAAEVGDSGTVDKLLDWCDNTYRPEWRDGRYVYPASKEKYMKITPGKQKKPIALTGILIAGARALSKDTMWRLHNEPFDEKHFNEPMVRDVDFPNVLVRRAIYDRKEQKLVLSLEPGTGRQQNTRFNIVNLDREKTWRLEIDGRTIGSYTEQTAILVDVPMNQTREVVLYCER